MWPFKRKKWEKLGSPWGARGLAFKLENELSFNAGAPSPILADDTYQAIPLQDFLDLVWDARTPNPWIDITYVKDEFDCNKYAVWFLSDVYKRWTKVSRGGRALAFGMIFAPNPEGINHAFIWQVDDMGSINFIEPQTNKVITWRPKSVNFVFG